jgi:hypothetical protein
MSDLLDNLLQKSQAQASTLAPRPVSMYEPAGGLGGDAVDEPDLEAGPPTEASPSVPRHVGPASPPPASPPDSRAPAMQRLIGLPDWLERLADRRESRLEAPDALLPPTPTRSPAAPPAQPQPPAVVRSPVQQSPGPAPARTPEERPALPAQAPTTSTIVRERTVVIRPAPPAAPERASTGGERGQIRARPAPPAPVVQAPRKESRPAAPAEHKPVERDVSHLVPRPAPAPAPRQRRDRQAPPTPTVPVVNVTIGRIEVRAKRLAATAPAASPSQRPSPVMSLDKYLKQRRGGSVR